MAKKVVDKNDHLDALLKAFYSVEGNEEIIEGFSGTRGEMLYEIVSGINDLTDDQWDSLIPNPTAIWLTEVIDRLLEKSDLYISNGLPKTEKEREELKLKAYLDVCKEVELVGFDEFHLAIYERALLEGKGGVLSDDKENEVTTCTLPDGTTLYIYTTEQVGSLSATQSTTNEQLTPITVEEIKALLSKNKEGLSDVKKVQLLSCAIPNLSGNEIEEISTDLGCTFKSARKVYYDTQSVLDMLDLLDTI